MKYTNVICTRCAAKPGVACNRPGGQICDPHSVRIAKSIALGDQVEVVVPAITLPVQKLKERFTLSGEPLPISVCMRKLGLEVTKEETKVFCYWPVHKETQFTLIFSESGWEKAAYLEDAESFESKPTTEVEVLMMLIRRHYMLRIKKDKINPSDEVVVSLSARLMPLATQVQLDALRDDIKRLQPLVPAPR